MDRTASADGQPDTAAPDPVSLQELLAPWPVAYGYACDVVLLLMSIALPILALAGVEGGVRNTVAVLVLAVAPGWGVLRAFRVPASLFTALAGIAISLCLTMLVGLIAVTRLKWQWRGALGVIEVVAIVALLAALVRHGVAARRPASKRQQRLDQHSSGAEPITTEPDGFAP